MFENLSKYQIVLASNSPRRKELLSGLGLDFSAATSVDVDESYPDSLREEEIPLYIARAKANAYTGVVSDETLLICADTVVLCDGLALGKPADADEARCMLSRLSGKTHQVVTAVVLATKDKQVEFAVSTEVSFDSLTLDEIDFYVLNYRPFDKAGSYGIQEWIGFVGVTGIRGSYFNVMGLPVQRLYKELKNF